VSFARFGVEGSQVYVFENTDDQFECCGCIIRQEDGKRATYRTPGTTEADAALMLAHLEQHVARGWTVPASCLDRFRPGAER
jgi:hypothetical protein